MTSINDYKIYIIGLGYVGLPLAIEFGKIHPTLGFDIDKKRIAELKDAWDRTLEISEHEFKQAKEISFSDELIIDQNKKSIFIVTVPTPIDEFKKPDLKPILSASTLVGKNLRKGDFVIYESTVYPGCTEEDCVPILENQSNLKFNEDFFCGYSPERINPGDKKNTLTNILKITSGSTPEAADFIDNLYKKIIKKGTYKAQNIKVAEAAKIIENCQRDINIAFVNELALLFNKLDIDTKDVLKAANTKWNFLEFYPGLVGGHCIGVDPYYLTYKAESVNYHPQVILSGRRINDSMGKFVANETIKLLIKQKTDVNSSRILILGFTFKENCPDIRNTRVIDIYSELKDYGISVDVYDPWASNEEVEQIYAISLMDNYNPNDYAAIILAVNHEEFNNDKFKKELQNYNGVIFDVKGSLGKKLTTKRL